MKQLLEQLAAKVAEEFNLDKDAILDKNENIFYFINNDSIIEVERKTHLFKCLYSGNQKVAKLLDSIKTIREYLM